VTFNRRILVQVTLPAILIGSLLLGACIVSLDSLHRLQINRSRILSSDVASLLAAQELQTRLRQLRFHSMLEVMEPTPARKKVVDTDHQEFEVALKHAREAASQPEDLRLLQAIQEGYTDYLQKTDEDARKLSPHPTVRECLDWADAHPLKNLIRPCGELHQVHKGTMEAAVESSEQVIAQTRWALVLLGVLGPLSGLAWGFGVAWGLSRSFTRLSVRVQDVHAHLDQELGSVRLLGEGDPGQLDQQMDLILKRVREVVTRLQEQEREILRAEQLSAVGQLAAGVAHEIRNPLASIKLLVSAASKARPPRPLTQEDLRVIHDEVERLERKVQALLDFARPSVAHKEPLELGAMIQQAIQLVQTRVRQQKVTVRVAGCDQPVTVYVDRDQFLSVLVNLFLNALDVMPHGGELKVLVERQPDGQVRLDVADTGPGFDPRVAGRLFTPFTSTKPTGTGLGLSVCRRVVEDYGGRLAATNRPEGGACLSITLPGTGEDDKVTR
jgi:signal transduction histidine kinase